MQSSSRRRIRPSLHMYKIRGELKPAPYPLSTKEGMAPSLFRSLLARMVVVTRGLPISRRWRRIFTEFSIIVTLSNQPCGF